MAAEDPILSDGAQALAQLFISRHPEHPAVIRFAEAYLGVIEAAVEPLPAPVVPLRAVPPPPPAA